MLQISSIHDVYMKSRSRILAVGIILSWTDSRAAQVQLDHYDPFFHVNNRISTCTGCTYHLDESTTQGMP